MREALVLDFRHIAELLPTTPFYFDATRHKPDHFPSSDNLWEPGIRWQTMLWQNKKLGLKFENRGTIEQPRISLSVYSHLALDQGYLDSLINEITYRYHLQMDLSAFYRKYQDHPLLGPVIQRWRGMRPLNYGSLYEYLIVAIVLQNATVRRSVSMMQSLFEHYGVLLRYDGKELSCFWEPDALQEVTEQELRSLKIGYRAKSTLRVTQAFIMKEIDEFELRNMQVEEQRRALLGLYGIGPASVGYILSDVFHQSDEMEHISPWEQKIYSKLFFNADPENPVPVGELMAYFDQHFPGYRNLAVHYFWEDLFWKRKHTPPQWLEKLIRL